MQDQAAPAPAAGRICRPSTFAWRLRIPPDGAPRGGQDGETYYINYWYPADGGV